MAPEVAFSNRAVQPSPSAAPTTDTAWEIEHFGEASGAPPETAVIALPRTVAVRSQPAQATAAAADMYLAYLLIFTLPIAQMLLVFCALPLGSPTNAWLPANAVYVLLQHPLLLICCAVLLLGPIRHLHFRFEVVQPRKYALALLALWAADAGALTLIIGLAGFVWAVPAVLLLTLLLCFLTLTHRSEMFFAPERMQSAEFRRVQTLVGVNHIFTVSASLRVPVGVCLRKAAIRTRKSAALTHFALWLVGLSAGCASGHVPGLRLCLQLPLVGAAVATGALLRLPGRGLVAAGFVVLLLPRAGRDVPDAPGLRQRVLRGRVRGGAVPARGQRSDAAGAGGAAVCGQPARACTGHARRHLHATGVR